MSNEVLLEFSSSASAQVRETLARDLQLTPARNADFQLTGRTIGRWRIDGTRSVADTLRLAQLQFPRSVSRTSKYAGATQYVVRKLHLLEAHRINSGDDVLVAVIDSKIDAGHPDLAGVIAAEYDAVGTPSPAHAHGTAMAGAIAAHSNLSASRRK